MTPSNPVTSRYLHKLLYSGRNDHFELVGIDRMIANNGQGLPVPNLFYYKATVSVPSENFEEKSASGATPHQAVQNALTSWGVQFK